MIAFPGFVASILLVAVDQTDPIPGTNIDNIFLAIAGIAVALVALAAAAHKTPIRQLGQGVGWVLRRLVGDPLSNWYARTFEERAEPIVSKAIANVLEQAGMTGDAHNQLREDVDQLLRWRIGVDARLGASEAPHVPTSEPPFN